MKDGPYHFYSTPNCTPCVVEVVSGYVYEAGDDRAYLLSKYRGTFVPLVEQREAESVPATAPPVGVEPTP